MHVLRCLLAVAALIPAAAAGSPRAAAGSAPAAAASCDAVAGLSPELLAPGTVLLLGEIHGTAEAPAFVADLACAAARAGRKVLVGLEVPREEAPRIAAFLAGAGGPAEREALLAGPFWRREYQDGRSSRAVADLLEEVRRLRTAGHVVAVTAFDRAERMGQQDRERAMATALAQAVGADPAAVTLALTGNLHARLRAGTPWDAELELMGYLLAQALPERRIVSLDISSTGGTAWTCTGAEAASCQARRLGGSGKGDAPRVTAGAALDANGYHGTYFVGALTASPPAVEAAAGR
jgi:hypothetical protein